MILAGDIGGTKTAIARYDVGDQGDLTQACSAIYASRDYPALEAIIQAFFAEFPGDPPSAACFGVAGPVIRGESRTTNLPWSLSEQVLAGVLRTPRVKLLNDLEAAAYGILFLGLQERVVLNPGAPDAVGNIAVVAAGTGLGEAILYWDGSRHLAIATEGGHSDFAPRTDLEIDLLRYLRARFGGHVSCERVLSGPGLYNLYEFLRDTGRGREPSWLTETLRSGDPSATISRHALSGDDPLCVAALELFVTLYGAEAGNLALKCLATGGVFIGGGIAPKILPALQSGAFMDGFLDKGRFAGLVRDIPVSVATNPNAALLGAAHFALRMAPEAPVPAAGLAGPRTA